MPLEVVDRKDRAVNPLELYRLQAPSTRPARIQVQHGVASAAAFRDRIGTGRKLAIQILEFFDRAGFTRRVKDSHVLRQPALFGPPEAGRG